MVCDGRLGLLKCPRFCSVWVDGKIWNMPRKFDQEAKDRVVRLVEARILAENISMQKACKIVAPKLGFRGTQRGNGRRPLDVKDALVNGCLREPGGVACGAHDAVFDEVCDVVEELGDGFGGEVRQRDVVDFHAKANG